MVVRAQPKPWMLVATLASLMVLTANPVPVTATEEVPSCTEASPCRIGPGTHTGTLRPYTAEEAHYILTPPTEPTVIRTELTANTDVILQLYDPDGTRRAYSQNWFGPAMGAAVAAPPGEWHLVVSYTPVSTRAFLGNTFHLTIGWDSYEHLARVDAPGSHSTSFTAEFAANNDARLDVVYASDGWDEQLHGALAMVEMIFLNVTNGGAFGGAGYLVGCCGIADSAVRTWGTPPDDLQLRPLPSEQDPFPLGTIGFDSRGMEARLAYGLSLSMGLAPTTAWIAYNGMMPDFVFSDDDRAYYLRLGDFEGDGPGVLAAGYANVQDLAVSFDVPGDDTHSTLLTVDGGAPALALRPTKATVTLPDNETIATDGRDQSFWWPDARGTWRVDIQHLDGFERDRLRVFGASFAFDDDWVFGPR